MKKRVWGFSLGWLVLGYCPFVLSQPMPVLGSGRSQIPVVQEQASVMRQGTILYVTDEEAMAGTLTLRVASGYGLNISFQRLREPIIRVWVDDVSELLLDFDQPLPDARVLHLRRLQPGELPLQTRSISRDTTMTVVTTRRIYQFFIRLSDTRSEYKVVDILPVSRQRIPIGGQDVATLSQLEQGILEAIRQERIPKDSVLIPRMREFVQLVRLGMEIEEASAKAGISLAVVAEFGKMGKRLPNQLERLRQPE